MKKIFFILLFCLITSNCFAALDPTIVWEVKTTGAATNGGGYKPGSTGTDFSQQNAAQYALTTATTAAADAIILDASAANDMVGNILYVVSGTNFIVGYYEIISVVAGVSITVDRDCTTDVGALGVINIGGAVDHPQRLTGITDTTDTMWIKKGVYQYLSGSYILDNSGGYIYKIIGYNATRGDDPTTVANMPQFDGQTTTDYGIYSENSAVINCAVYNNTNTGIRCNYGSVINCVAYSNTITGIYSNISGSVINCVTYSNDEGIHSYYGSVINCVAYSNTTNGIQLDRSLATNCIVYNNGNGIYIVRGSVINCVAYSNTTNGFYSFTYLLYFDYNCYYGNGTNLSGITAGSHDVNADPLFTDPTGTPPDFTLQSTSPCLLSGSPGAMPGLTGAYKYNIGVDQDDNTATGGAGGGAGFFTMGD